MTLTESTTAHFLALIAGEEAVLAEAATERTALRSEFPGVDYLAWMMLVGSECMIGDDRVETANALIAKWRGQIAA